MHIWEVLLGLKMVQNLWRMRWYEFVPNNKFSSIPMICNVIIRIKECVAIFLLSLPSVGQQFSAIVGMSISIRLISYIKLSNNFLLWNKLLTFSVAQILCLLCWYFWSYLLSMADHGTTAYWLFATKLHIYGLFHYLEHLRICSIPIRVPDSWQCKYNAQVPQSGNAY